MKKALLTFGLIFPFLMLGQEKIAEISTDKCLYELPGYAPSIMTTKVSWEVYQDSIVMTYVGKAVLKRLEKSGVSTVNVYAFPLNMENNTLTYQGDNTRIIIVRTGKKDVITVENKDDFTGDISKMMYY